MFHQHFRSEHKIQLELVFRLIYNDLHQSHRNTQCVDKSAYTHFLYNRYQFPKLISPGKAQYYCFDIFVHLHSRVPSCTTLILLHHSSQVK